MGARKRMASTIGCLIMGKKKEGVFFTVVEKRDPSRYKR